jgi:glycosyltransferase involved in cell wall biosynthesis
MKLSVVVPVYNSEQYLEKAVKSILDQSIQDFELILVDDCGKDRSGQICDELSQRDSRIKVIHAKDNGGICRARNTGMKVAHGEYIAFCDDDDLYMPRLLEESYRLAKKYNADMVKFGRKLIDVLKDGSVIRERETKGTKLKVYKGTTKYKDYYEVKSRGYLTNLWNGIYKLETVRENELFFDEDMKFGSEDMDFSLRLYDIADSVVVSPETFYIHYRRDASSTSRRFNDNKIQSMLKTAEHELPIWNKIPDGVLGQVDRNRLVSEYLRNVITIQLLHEDCSHSNKKKANIIRELCTLPQMKFNYQGNVIFELFKKDKKSWATVILAKYNASYLLLAILNFYRKHWGDKWE